MKPGKALALSAALGVTALISAAGTAPVRLECQACDEERCMDPDKLYFGPLGQGSYLAVCGLQHCCIETSGQCSDAIECFGDDDNDFAFATIADFANALSSMSAADLHELLRAHPEHIEFSASRGAVVLRGCNDALKAVLPLARNQLSLFKQLQDR